MLQTLVDIISFIYIQYNTFFTVFIHILIEKVRGKNNGSHFEFIIS